ncbi:MAG: ribosome silencing factor [Polyangiaceae bacterium]
MAKKREDGRSSGPKKTRGPRIRSSHGTQRDVMRGGVETSARRVSSPKKVARANDSPSVASDEARQLATWIAVAALEKKAVGLEILDVAGKVDYADFLVLMTGRSDRQVSALTQGIEEALKKKNKRPLSVEGMPHANWVLMDYGDVVVHVFQDQARGMYDLEGLWMDARRLPVPLPEGVR